MMAVYLWQRSGSLALGGICYCLTITECETCLYRNPSRLLLLTLRERRKTFKIGEKEKINTCFKKTQFDVLLIFCPPCAYVSGWMCTAEKVNLPLPDPFTNFSCRSSSERERDFANPDVSLAKLSPL